MTIDTFTLQAELAQFTGTEQYYVNALYREMNYTDGIKHLVTTVSAYWLLDIIGTECFPRQKSGEWDSFVAIHLVVEACAMKIRIQDGNYNPYEQKNIPHTDFPTGEWVIWLIDGVLLLPSEY